MSDIKEDGPSTGSMFHAGHRTLQDRFDGRRIADALERHRRLAELGPDQIELIESSAFFFLATAHARSVDCSFKGGPPGFIRVTGPTSLEWPDFDGNSMYRSLGNIAESPSIGLLFIRMDGTSYRLRVNGDAALDFDDPTLANWPGAKVMIRLQVREIFPNCPRYIPDLASDTMSEFLPQTGKPLAKPAWKDRDYIQAILPEGDPHKE
ncbi:MAG: pyridoxamine 5'-phosphate oxidase family protein [Pseudomonadota bacterium]